MRSGTQIHAHRQQRISNPGKWDERHIILDQQEDGRWRIYWIDGTAEHELYFNSYDKAKDLFNAL